MHQYLRLLSCSISFLMASELLSASSPPVRSTPVRKILSLSQSLSHTHPRGRSPCPVSADKGKSAPPRVFGLLSRPLPTLLGTLAERRWPFCGHSSPKRTRLIRCSLW